MSSEPQERATCGTCPAYLNRPPKNTCNPGDTTKNTKPFGECRAYPPKTIENEGTIWPTVQENDYCMEHPENRTKFSGATNNIGYIGDCIQNLEGFLRSR